MVQSLPIACLVTSLAFSVVFGAPTREPMERPAYVLKFVALLPGLGPAAYCDYNNSPKVRNRCDFRVHFDVLYSDDPSSIPYGKLEYDLPNNADSFVADSTAMSDWPSPLPDPSYPGVWKTLSSVEYERIVKDDKEGRPIQLRITVFDRDDVGRNDMIGQQTFDYTMDEVLRWRERIQTKDVQCTSEAQCQSLRLKFMFYMLDN